MKSEWNDSSNLKRLIKHKKKQKKTLQEANKLNQEADKKVEEANKQVEEVKKRADESDKEIEKMNQERVLMIQTMLKNGMSVSQIAKCLSKGEEEILEVLKKPLFKVAFF